MSSVQSVLKAMLGTATSSAVTSAVMRAAAIHASAIATAAVASGADAAITGQPVLENPRSFLWFAIGQGLAFIWHARHAAKAAAASTGDSKTPPSYPGKGDSACPKT